MSDTPAPVVAVSPTPPAPAVPASPPAAVSPSAPATPGRPDWLPEAHWDGQANTIKPDFGKHYGELVALKTEHDARTAQVPAKPEDYKLALPDDFVKQLPKDVKIEFDEKDARVGALRTLAHQNKWDQATVSGILALEAQRQLAEREALHTAVQAEHAKLGDNRDDRFKAIDAVLASVLTPDEVAELGSYKTSFHATQALEKLINRTTAIPGSAPPAPAPKPSDIPIHERWYSPNSQQKAS